MAFKVLVCGSRDWYEWGPIERELSKLPPGTIIIHGGARGADTLAGDVAHRLGFEVRCYPADWERYKRAAGPIRNAQMLKDEHRPGERIDLVLAFSKNFAASKGTADMMRKAEAAGIFVDPHSV